MNTVARAWQAALSALEEARDLHVKLVYILGQIGKVLELTVIEQRLTQLEDRSRG